MNNRFVKTLGAIVFATSIGVSSLIYSPKFVCAEPCDKEYQELLELGKQLNKSDSKHYGLFIQLNNLKIADPRRVILEKEFKKSSEEKRELIKRNLEAFDVYYQCREEQDSKEFK